MLVLPSFQPFAPLESQNLISRKNLTDTKIMNFPQCRITAILSRISGKNFVKVSGGARWYPEHCGPRSLFSRKNQHFSIKSMWSHLHYFSVLSLDWFLWYEIVFTEKSQKLWKIHILFSLKIAWNRFHEIFPLFFLFKTKIVEFSYCFLCKNFVKLNSRNISTFFQIKTNFKLRISQWSVQLRVIFKWPCECNCHRHRFLPHTPPTVPTSD